MLGSLRDIRLFVAAYEERSFTSAAAREHATQSGVSQHVRNLEETFGVKLFRREKGRVAPTPAGDTYYRRCIDVLRAHEAATRAVRSFSARASGEIVVGLMPTMTRCTLAPALARYIELYPNMAVRVVEGYSANLTQMVRSGELDFAIVPAFAGLPGLKSRLFLRTPECLVSRPCSDLVHGEAVRLSDLAPLKLVVPSKTNTRRQTIETYCATAGVSIERMLELDAMLATLDFVARTEWVAVLPAIMMADKSGQFTTNPLAEPALNLDLVLIEPSRKLLAPAAEQFLLLLEEEARLLSPELVA